MLQPEHAATAAAFAGQAISEDLMSEEYLRIVDELEKLALEKRANENENPPPQSQEDPFFQKIQRKIRPGVDVLSLRSSHLSCNVTLQTSSVHHQHSPQPFRISVDGPVSCDYYDTFGAHRFLVVYFKHVVEDGTLDAVQQDSLRRFFDQGIQLEGRHYALLGGEQLGRGDRSLEGAEEEDMRLDETDMLDARRLRLWYFAERDDSGHLTDISVAHLIDWLGEFPRDTPPSKVNARIKLGMSRTQATCTLTPEQVIVVEDVQSPDGHIMTDGCGFISHTLARQIPYDISNGQMRRERTENMSCPAVIQMRLRCRQGLFKGCLVVVADPSVCPAGCVVLRPSMRKAGPSSSCTDCSSSVLRVNCTFEHPSCMEHGPASHSDSTIMLNRSLCLLLHYLGVPYKIFERLMKCEIQELLNATLSRKQAYSLVERYIRSWNGSQPHPTRCTHTDTGPGEKAKRFLLAGHALDEPMLREHLTRIQLQGVTRLEHCRMRLAQSTCLVGIPDPLKVLREDEVYIVLPKDREDVVVVSYSEASFSVTGKVAVTRSPTFHPGAIRLLTAVQNAALHAMFQESSGGVIVFPTNGSQSPAAYMSGGDFDGDKYYAIFNSEIVDAMTEVRPFEEICPIRLPSVATFGPMPEDDEFKSKLRWSMFTGLVQEASQSLVGKYGNALKAWLDPSVIGGGPGSENLNHCYSIYLTALDAAKTGARVKTLKQLLNVPKPHYLIGHTKDSIRSVSVAGMLYDIVKGVSVELYHGTTAVCIDPELTYCPLDSSIGLEEAKEDLLKSMYMKPCGPSAAPLGEQWKEHYQQYRLAARSAFEELKDPFEIGVYFENLKKKYVNLFNENVDAFLVENYGYLFNSQGTSGSEAYRLPNAHLDLLRNSLREKTRRQLATVIYVVVYNAASSLTRNDLQNSNNQRGGQYAAPKVSFCWDVCSAELHRNKGENVCRRGTAQGVARVVIETLVSTEMEY